MFRLFITSALLISAGLCGEKAEHPLPVYHDFGTDYSCRLMIVEERGAGRQRHLKVLARVDTKGDQFSGDRLAGFASVPGYGFWLDVTNKGQKSIRLLWPRARYIDEVGHAHTVYHYVIGDRPPSDVLTPGPPTELARQAMTRQVISPGYKTYMIEEGGEDHVFEEPLVPTTLKGRTAAQMKAYVDDLAKRQVPVKLMLPVEIDGVRYDYTFTFLLKPLTSPLKTDPF